MANGRFGRGEPQASQIVGVVPDFTTGSIRTLIQPSVYYIDPNTSFVLVLTLEGARIPETMRALEAAWKDAARGRPMVGGQFLSQMLDTLYIDIRRQTQLFAAFSLVTIVVAALGLLGLAVFTAERQTREIGVRKVHGREPVRTSCASSAGSSRARCCSPIWSPGPPRGSSCGAGSTGSPTAWTWAGWLSRSPAHSRSSSRSSR